MIDIILPEEEEKTLKINFTEEQKQAFEEFIARQNKLLLKAEPSVDNIPPDTGDMYLEKFQNVADELCNIIEHSLDDEREQVLIRTSFLKDIDWLLSVGHRAYMDKPNNDVHEISKTLKEILREMRKRKC